MGYEPSSESTSLKNLRIVRSLSQNEVAKAIGTNANTVSRWERGIAAPSPYYRRKLAELFEVDPQAIFSDPNSGKTPIPPDGPPPPPFKNKTHRWIILPSGILIVALVFGGIIIVLLSLPSKTPTARFPPLCSGNFQSTNTSIVLTSATSLSSDGVPIGLSEGANIFDLQRSKPEEVQDKLQAAQDWVNNPQAVVPWLNNALNIDPTDAEAQIYRENWRVLGSNHPHITFIVGVSFSSTSDERYNGTSRDALQGAFTAQKECNNHNNQDSSQTQVVLMIANIGANVYGNNVSGNTTFVANQIVDQAHKDPTIVGIMGWLFSADSVNMNHQLKISGSQLPMVSPASATDVLGGTSHFFRICNTNTELAQIAADFTLKIKNKKRIAILYAPGNTYANNLQADFYGDIKNNSAGLPVPFTGGKLDTLQRALESVIAQNPDAIFFSGYEGDLFQLLADPAYLTFAHSRNLLIVSAPALDATSNYPNPLPDMSNVYFPSTSSPDEWDNVTPKPPFFQEYKDNFGTLTAPTGLPSIDADAMGSYDALLTLLYASQQALSKHNNTIIPSYLENELKQITGPNAIQGVTGRIAFDSDGNQDKHKMIFMEHIDGYKLVIDKQHGCLLKDNCSS